MRRKSDRTPSKKPKPSPEKKEKVEKIKRPRTRRRKQSTTSESESAEEPVQAVQKVEVVESKIEVPPKSVKEDSPEESQEQVWHVKATETSGDVGEIKKLKICLARPSSTPERSDRSPRSKRKHSRATSSSDTQSIEGEEKKKTRHRSKRGTFESKDTLEKNQAKAIDSQADEAEAGLPAEVAVSDSTESCKETIDKETAVDETPMSTTCEDDKVETTIIKNTNETELKDNISTSKAEVQIKSSDADTTVVSPKIQVDDDEEEKELPVRRAKRLSEKKGKFEAKEKLRLEIVQEESTETGVKASSVIDKKAPSVIDEKPSSVIDEKPSSVIDEQPSSVKDENPSSVIDEKPSSVIDEKPSSVIDEKASSVIVEKAPSVIDEKASTVIEKSTSQQDEKILPESKENLLDDTVQKGSSAKEKKGKIEGEENKSSDIKKTEDVKEEIKPTEDVKEDVKKPSEGEHAPSEKEEKVASPKVKHSPIRKRSLSIEKSEILELHAEESRCESSDMCLNECQDSSSETKQVKDVIDVLSSEVSINETSTEISGKTASSEDPVSTNENNVVESTKNVETEKLSNVSVVDNSYPNGKDAEVSKENHHKPLDINKTPNSDQQEIQNGQATPIVTSRKRRWGSRPSRLSTQKSITISTDVLKEIIPDVKPVEFDEVIEENKPKRVELSEKFDRPVLPKIIIDNTDSVEPAKKEQRLEERDKENVKSRDTHLASARKISIVKENDSIISRPPSPPRHKQSNILYITNLVRPFTLPQLKNLLQRTGRIMENGFWIDRIKSKCFVKYETEDQATETRHALHGVTWPVSNPKTLHVDFSTEEDFNKAQENVGTENTQTSTIPGTVEDWLREQDMKREKGDMEKPWERKAAMREWDMGKNEKGKEEARPDKLIREERPLEKRRHRTPERSPEPAKKFKKKEEEAPAKLLDDLFRKTKTTPCIYWLPLSAETIAVKEEQRRQHMAEHERRLQELRRNRRH